MVTKTKSTEKYIETVGRRKTAVARVRVTGTKKEGAKGTTVITVNGKKYSEYFPLLQLQKKIISPFEKSDLSDGFIVSAHVQGGGVAAQAEAIRHGIARALILYVPEIRKKLKKLGYLKRDPRMVERKKYGLKKARKSPQWSKR